MDLESKIIHESGHFYIFKTSKGFEIRKMGPMYSLVLGTAPTIEAALRFVERANRYPNRF